MEKEFKSGFVTLIGRTNVGKSTLLNLLVGEKVAAIANKVQTTRTAIKGIVNRPNSQIIFTDTPGIHKPHTKLNETMLETSFTSLADADVVLFLIEATSNEIGRSISDNVENRMGNSISSYTLGNTNVFILYGSPKPYTRYQEIYMDLIPVNQYIDSGIWIIRIIPEVSVVGRYDMWLPGNQSINTFTGFLKPDPEITLTIPSATDKAISVGAYDTSTDKVASFSGRGFTRENNQIKPDIVAPGVNIRSAATGGGTTVLSGTSMATPFVTGSAALMMEWGIVRGNDPYLYGEKIKAYLIRGAKHLPGYEQWPNKQAGWGALCLRDGLV